MTARNDASFSRSVRTLAAAVGFNDPANRGELAQLFDGPGRTRKYLRRAGVTIDEFGELLFDRRLTHERLAANDVLALLGTVFDGTSTGQGKRNRATRGVMSAIEREAERAKKNRSRKFACPECDDRPVKCNAAVSTFEGLCGRCYRVRGAIVPLVRCDPTFSEVMAQVEGAV